MEGKIFVHGKWVDKGAYLASLAPKGEGPAVYGDIEEHVGVGFPGQPVVKSRSHLRQLFRENPHLVPVGSEGSIKSRRT